MREHKAVSPMLMGIAIILLGVNLSVFNQCVHHLQGAQELGKCPTSHRTYV